MRLALVPEGIVHRLRIPLFSAALLLGLVELVHALEGGESVHTTDVLEVHVRQVDQLRVHHRVPIDIEIRNISGQRCDVSVWLSTEEGASFEAVQMIPEPGEDGAAQLADLAPGEQRLVSVELESDHAGPRGAELRIRGSTGDELVVPIRAFAMP